VSDVDADVGWLADRVRILELTARYNRCYDEGDPEGFAALFVEDGVMEVEGGFRVQGRDELADMVRRMPWGIMHVTVDPVVDVDGDVATQLVTLLVLRRAGADGDNPSRLTGTGRYTDDLTRTPAGWRFVRRSVVLDGGLRG
jgi:uncharacterized protein (TIGR02246 family)